MRVSKRPSAPREFPYSVIDDGVTQGLLAIFLECRVKAKLNIFGHWTSVKSSVPMDWGNMFHSCVEQHYTGIRDGNGKSPQELIADVAYDFEERERYKGVPPSAEREQDIERMFSLLDVMFPAYVKFHTAKDKKKKWIALETDYRALYQCTDGAKIFNVWLRGKIDGVFKQGKDTYGQDTKTKGRIESMIIELLAMDLQMGFYDHGYKKITGKYPAGWIYDIIRRPEHKVSAKESIDKFKERLAADVADRPDHFFKRLSFTFSDTERARHLLDLNGALADFAKWLSGALPTYHNSTSCKTPYGTCKYLPICANGDYSQFHQREELFPELED